MRHRESGVPWPFGCRKGAAASSVRRWIIRLGLASLVGCPVIAAAQIAPSQVTPQTLRPPTPREPARLDASPAEPLQLPPGAVGLKFRVGRIVIEGGFSELENETLDIVKTIEGKSVTVAELYAFATALEQIYARAGYILARITLPPQALTDNGPVRVVVTDGYIENVQIENVPERVRPLLGARLAPLVGRPHVTLSEIERILLIAEDVPGLRLKSGLGRGSIGGAVLVVEGTHHLVTGGAYVGNPLSDSLGTWNYGANVSLNSPMGLGEQFYASAQSAGDLGLVFDDFSPLRVLGGGLVVPLGMDGWIFNPEYTYSRSRPLIEDGGIDTIGTFQRVALRTSRPVIRTRARTFALNAAYEYITQQVELPLFETDLNRDRYGAVRVGASYEANMPWTGGFIVSSGLFSRGLGGRDQADVAASGVPLSRLGASSEFNKLNIDARLIQLMPGGFRADLIARAQSSFGKALLVSEQMSLDGPTSLSAFDSGMLSVDEGATLRLELSRPFTLPTTALTLVPYLFGTYGGGRLNEPTVLETAEIRAGAAGIGVRGNVDAANGYGGASFGVELGRQYTNLPDFEEGWRANVNASVRF